MSVSPHGSRSAASRLVLQGIVWAVLAATFHSLVPVAVRLLSGKLPPIEIVFLRNVIGFSVLMALFAVRGIGTLRTHRLGWHVQRSTINFIGMWFWFAALGMMPIGQAVALHFTLPLFTAIFAVIFLAERPGPARWAATAAGFLGVLVILRPGLIEIGWASMLVLGSAALYGGTQIYTRLLGRTEDASVTTFYYQFFLTVFAAVPALWDWVTPGLDDVPAILLLAFAGTVAPYCIIRALKCAEATAVVPFEFLRLPFTIAMGYMFFSETTDLWTWVGGAIIFGATYLITVREARAREG
jgi:drug/metabolite transporter (DMT)-like permease